MPMGIIPDDEFDADVVRVVDSTIINSTDDIRIVPIDESAAVLIESGNESQTNEAAIARITELRRGRGIGSIGISESKRAEIASHAIEFGNASALSRFPVSQSSVSAYKTGHTSTSSDEPDMSLLESVNHTKRKIATKASARLDMALEHVTDEKLANAKLKDLATIATAMSGVIKNMEPEIVPQNQQNVQFVFFAPKNRTEESFDVIQVLD